ncbi:MAG: hypothetical protein J6K01_07270 [Paludibacteraceae bacterium]|nr:hypothetical protein [Paludibacteraceae bacterium]
MAEIGKTKDPVTIALDKLSEEEIDNMTDQELCDYLEKETGERYVTSEEFWSYGKELIRKAYEEEDNI